MLTSRHSSAEAKHSKTSKTLQKHIVSIVASKSNIIVLLSVVIQ